MKLLLEIITPEKALIKDEVDQIIAPTKTGQITILPNHIALLTQVDHGELVIKKGNSEQFLAIAGGFLEVANNKVTLLADYAVRSEDINAIEAMEAKKRAEKLMQEKVSKQDFAMAEASLRRSLLELKVVQRRKNKPLNSQ